MGLNKMITEIKGVPKRYSYGCPYHDRPRSSDYYGVTEILFCLRKGFLQRVVPAPSAIDFDTRVRFARGHSLESAFFGERHNPEYFIGGGNLKGLEGHSDHVVRDSNGKIDEIVEFKSVRRLWYKAPNGKAYYSRGMARKAIDKKDWDKIEHRYNDSHMDQLKIYMYITGVSKGVLLYYEMSTDDYYCWEITSDEIDDEFKERIESRLKTLQKCMDEFIIPEKSFSYDWECNLCSHNKSGMCTLCDQPGFDLQKVCEDLNSGDIEKRFDKVINEQLDKYGIKGGMESTK